MEKSRISVRKKFFKVCMVVFILGLLFSFSWEGVLADVWPRLPHAFYGDIVINGSPAPAGTKVEVMGTGVSTGTPGNPIFTTEEGKYGVDSPLGMKLIAQGTVENETVLTFVVNDLDTGQTFIWEEGAVTKLDLTLATTTETCELTVICMEGGTVTEPAESPYSTLCGSVVDIMAVPDGCYEFAGWTGDTQEAVDAINDPSAAETFITLSDNFTITASFNLKQSTLDVSVTAGGTIVLPEENPFTVPCGTIVTIQAMADECYEFVEWTGNVSTVDDVYAAETTIIMNNNYTITAVFEPAGVAIPVNEGWNTFSTPVILNECMNTWDGFITFNDLQASVIYGYDSAAGLWTSPGGSDEILCGYGYYVKADETTVVYTVPDMDAEPFNIPLDAGVHLVGTPQFLLDNIDVATALETLYQATNGQIGYIMVVSPYINAPNSWAYIRDAGNPPIMIIGRAYWLVMENAGNYSYEILPIE